MEDVCEEEEAFKMKDMDVNTDTGMDTEAGEGMKNAFDSTQEVITPEAGMTFPSLDKLVDYYRIFGKQEGFGVTRQSRTSSYSGNSEYVTVACSRNGKSQSKKRNILKPNPVVKTGCKARINASVFEDGTCRINSVALEHNHALSPSKSRFFVCNRELTIGAKRRLELNDMAGVGVSRNFLSCVVQGGGYENVGFLEKDCRNYVEKARRLRLGVGDAEAMLNYFTKMQAKNSCFFYAMDVDEKFRIKNVFWADARSRAAYDEFGDVVTFDTTYLTNKYDMPFAPFVGVNHHGQSILLGCGLLSNEDTTTFTWLFRTWLQCMSNRAPNAIITDQDRAMQNAIEIVFPNTRHRWCLWHILKKVPEKLRSYSSYESIKRELRSAVYDSFTKEEFEEKWCGFVNKYDLSDNAWLSGLYEERRRWVPTLVKDIFWAGMSTSQRSESMNAFFDGYVNSKTTLKQFVEQYDNALKSKAEKENIADFQSFNTRIPCVTQYDIEKQFQLVYTCAKFQEFQEEVVAKLYCEVNFVGQKNSIVEFEVTEDVFIGEDEEKYIRQVNFSVNYDRDNAEVYCTCRMFEFRGILCRHIVSTLIKLKVHRVSEHYLLSRWRKDITRRYTKIRVGSNILEDNPKIQRYDYLSKKFEEATDIAVESDELTKMLWDNIEAFQSKVVKGDIQATTADAYASQRHFGVSSSETQCELSDPKCVKRHGRPPSKRKKSNLEIGTKMQPKSGKTNGNSTESSGHHVLSRQMGDANAKGDASASGEGAKD